MQCTLIYPGPFLFYSELYLDTIYNLDEKNPLAKMHH